ncbi:MAG: hypothetical protein AABY85_01450 [Gemmatimonadota bacterium]
MPERGPTPAGRPLPWTALVAALGEKRFEEIREALAGAKTDALNRDAFLLNGTVGQLLRDLVPEDAPAESVNGYGALLHMLYVHWGRAWPVTRIAEPALRAALEATPPYTMHPKPFVSYIQLPERLVWAEPERGAPHEPVDGLFAVAASTSVRVLAVLGFRAEREGFTTIECGFDLPIATPGLRPDGTPAFTSLIPGGLRAKLFSVADPHESAALALLALAAAES